jgi:hypothetical protein
MEIWCCKGCTEKYDYCHSHCDKYIIEKAFHDALKAEEDKKKSAKYSVKAQRDAQVEKAIRHRRRASRK